MAAKDDCESSKEEGDKRKMDIAPKLEHRARRIAASCPRGHAIGEEESEINEEAVDNEEEFRRNAIHKLKRAAHGSLLSVKKKRLELQERNRSERQLGDSQVYNGLWICKTCHARRHVPTSET